jgi:hypothetical protein
MADGSLRITLEFEPRFARDAYALFGSRGTPVAVAALKPASSKPEAPKGGPLAQWVAMRCQEPDFQVWIANRYPTEWSYAPGNSSEEVAAAVVRDVCGVDSRAELDSNPKAAARLHKQIREPYKEQT